MDAAERESSQAHAERYELLDRLDDWLDGPLTLLAGVMLGLLVVDFAANLPPTWEHRVQQAETAIWAIFIADFLLEFTIAPSKLAYLRRNWLTVISLALPAFRAVRILRIARAVRGLSLVRVVTTFNRGTRALSDIVERGRFSYVVGLTIAVIVVAAASAYYFEVGEPGATIQSFGDALWWSSTLVTTMNSPLYVVTVEGRFIGLVVRVFALALSGYLTAILAVAWIGAQPAAPSKLPDPALAEELRRLRQEVARLRSLLEEQPTPASPNRHAA